MLKINLHTHKDTLKKALALHDRKDLTIDCVLEGTMCNVYANSLKSPEVFLIKNGPFHILAGDHTHDSATNLLATIADDATILPSPPEWIAALNNQKNIILQKYNRYCLDHSNISVAHLNKVIDSISNQYNISRIDAALAADISHNEQFKYHFQNFNSASDFLQRGLGYAVVNNGLIIGIASSALVCNKGFEINIMLLPQFRGMSLGKLLAAYLVREIISRNKIPHWDAANEISLNLAKQLGYDFIEKYHAYRVKYYNHLLS